ncbi:MAG: CYTH domain-containing protein [bacterium]
MKTEYEATFLEVNKDEVRAKLLSVGAKKQYDEFLQRRQNFNFPKGHEIEGGWVRVRKEYGKTTMALKIVKVDGRIDEQKEIQLNIDNFENACELLETLGCKRKAFQESKRELWTIDDVEVTIDEWPFLYPYIEVEGNSEEAVKQVSIKLGFDYSKAYFGSIDGLYQKKYNIPLERINEETPEILFSMEKNPFI